MLHINHPLYFPQFSREGETTFKSHSDSKRKTALYKLNWDQVDKIKKDHWNKWIKNHWPDTKTKNGRNPYYVPTLPEKYDNWVKNLIYAIPHHYMEEIRCQAKKALSEWSKHYPFDTNIREECLIPAIGHAYVAFHLIADCVYDSKTNYFYRGDDSAIVTQALLYKFWSRQTGRGLIRNHSFFSKIDNKYHKNEEVQKFINTINEHEKILENGFPEMEIVESQPSLNEPHTAGISANISEKTDTLITNNDTNKVPGISANISEKTDTFTISNGTNNERPKSNTPVKGTNKDITVCTTCMDRNEDLLRVIPTWLKYGFGELIIVDWGSVEPVTETLKNAPFEIPNTINIKIIRVEGFSYFAASFVKNVAIRACSTEKILLIDCDVKLKGFDYEISDDKFYCGDSNETGPGTTGTCLINKKNIDLVNGFNENMTYWGAEDVNFFHRLDNAGIKKELFRKRDLEHIDHNDNIRLRRRNQQNLTKIEGQRYNINKARPWKNTDEQRKVTASVFLNGKQICNGLLI